MRDRIISISMRSFTLVGKLVLVLILARFLSPSDVGEFGLVVATVSYALYFVGLDFYTFTQREIFNVDKSRWSELIKSQLTLSMNLYVLFFFVTSIALYFKLLSLSAFIWLFLILVVEHLSQELSRLLAVLSMPLQSGVVLFMRHGLWSISVPICFYFYPQVQSLNFVFLSWVISGFFGVVYGSTILAQASVLRWSQDAVNWSWIRSGVKIAFPLLISTLTIRTISTLDRYWFEDLNGRELLGSYVLFVGLGNALQSFMDSGVYVFRYPMLIQAFHKKDNVAFVRTNFKLIKETIFIITLFVIAVFVFTQPILDFIGKPIYQQHIEILYYTLLSSILLVLSMVPHFALYAQGKDRALIVSHFLALVVFVLAVFATASRNPVLAVPFGLCAASGIILLSKVIAFLWLTPSEFRDTKSIFRRK